MRALFLRRDSCFVTISRLLEDTKWYYSLLAQLISNYCVITNYVTLLG